MPTVSVSNAVAQESYNEYLSFEVSLSEPALDAVSFYYRALPGTATNSDVYSNFNSSGTSGQAVIAPGDTSVTINIRANSDNVDERDESVVLQLSNLSPNADFAGGETVLRGTGVILDNDGSGSNLALFVSDPILTEGDAGTKEAVFEVRLSQPATSNFSVNYSTRDISAKAGSDYLARFGTLNFAAGETVKQVTVQVLGDTAAEITESFALVLDAPSSPTLGTAGLAGEATILDDDSGTGPVVSVRGATVEESYSEYIAFEVTLSEAALDTVTLSYRALEGTATGGDIYSGFDRTNTTYGTVQFAPGVTSQIVYIRANSDNRDERDESIVLKLTNLSQNAVFAGGEDNVQATGVILDDDGTGSNLALFVSDPDLVEGDSGVKEAIFEVRLSRPATEAFTVNYSTRDISATAGSDYVRKLGSLSFAPGEQVKTVSVNVLGDAAAEGTERFALIIDAPSSPSLGLEGLVGTATVRDDDTGSGPVVSVSDAIVQESYNEYLSFEVTLSEPSLETVSLSYRALEGTADSSDVYSGFDRNSTTGTIELAPGVTSKIIYIRANSDNLDERDESVVLELSSLSENARFEGGEATVRATGIIQDDDGAGSNLAVIVSDPVLLEGDSGTKMAQFDVHLSAPLAQPLTVTYLTKDITAVAGSDYVAQNGSLTFAPGETLRSVSVQVLGDETSELSESFALVLNAPDTLSLRPEGLVGEAVIQDDDTMPAPVISVSNASSFESYNEYLTFKVSLSQPSTTAVTIDYRAKEGTGDGNDLYSGLDRAGSTTGTVTFAPGETSKFVYIRANSDSTDERDETILLELSNAKGGSFAGGATRTEAVGFILDDDGVGPNRAVFVSPTITREQGAAVTEYEIPILMSREASVPLSFDVAAIDQSATLGRDYRLLDSSVTFLPGQTSTAVRVQILGDATDEVTETFGLSVTLQDGMPFVGSVPTGIVTIENGPRIPTMGDDVLTGTSNPDLINLLAGNDFYSGLAGDDTVRGGNGQDTIVGGSGTDVLMGQAGNDMLIGGINGGNVSGMGGTVYRLYQATLDRAPDMGGFASWVAQLESEQANLLDVSRGFVASKEFQNVYGELGNAGFVNLLYNNVLGRNADAGGLSGWLSQLSGGTSRQQVVIGFSESAEFKAATATEANAYSNALSDTAQSAFLDDVFRLYRATLDRSPDLGGLEGWSTQLAAGQSFVSIAGGFTNSTEFRNTYGAVGDSGFVTLLYNNVLDRAPDAAGLNAWLNQMSNGLTREGVVRGFAQSREFVNKTAPAFEGYMKSIEGDVFNGGSGNDRMAGGIGADTFIFNAGEDGANLVLQIDDWDTVRFDGFGYDTAGDALARMTATDTNVRFADQGVSIEFAGADLETMQSVDYLFG